MKKNKLFAGIFLICFSFVSLSAYSTLDIELRFFEGIRRGENDLSYFIPHGFLQPTFIAVIQKKSRLTEEAGKIKRLFNLQEVNLINGNEYRWRLYKSAEISHLLSLHDREYLISVAPIDRDRKHQFRIKALEVNGDKKKVILDTRIVLPWKDIAVIGFEDGRGKPYFVSFRAIGGILGGVITRGHIVGGVVGCVEKKQKK